MKKFGVCVKCGKYKEVRNHHFKGYKTDETLPYCRSCDRQAHNKAKREGRCTLSAEEIRRKSNNMYCKRFPWRYLTFHERLMKGIRLVERIEYCEEKNFIKVISDIKIRA